MFSVLSNINSTLQLYIHKINFNNIIFLPMSRSSKHILSFRFSDQIDWGGGIFELTFILVFC